MVNRPSKLCESLPLLLALLRSQGISICLSNNYRHDNPLSGMQLTQSNHWFSCHYCLKENPLITQGSLLATSNIYAPKVRELLTLGMPRTSKYMRRPCLYVCSKHIQMAGDISHSLPKNMGIYHRRIQVFMTHQFPGRANICATLKQLGGK